MLTLSGMTDSEKNDFINFIYGQLKEREAQNEALHAKLDAQMDRFDKLQATLVSLATNGTQESDPYDAMPTSYLVQSDFRASLDVPVYRHPSLWGVKIGRLLQF